MLPEHFTQQVNNNDGQSANNDDAPFLSVQRGRAKYASAKQCQNILDENDASHDLDKPFIIQNMVKQVQSFYPDVKPIWSNRSSPSTLTLNPLATAMKM